MSTLKGDEAKRFLDEILLRTERIKQEQFEAAKEAAMASGKEPFNLEQLETLCDTSLDGFVPPTESRRRDLEYRYYVLSPTVRTLEEFAALITRTSRY
jgi:hypothetical protein